MIQIKNPLKKASQTKKAKKEKPKERSLSDLTTISSLNGIMKLRISIATIVLFMSISFVLAITSEFAFSVGLIIISYLLLIIILIKLFLIKKI